MNTENNSQEIAETLNELAAQLEKGPVREAVIKLVQAEIDIAIEIQRNEERVAIGIDTILTKVDDGVKKLWDKIRGR